VTPSDPGNPWGQSEREPIQSDRFTLFLIRHGETAWNAEGRFQGILDSPLTDRGIAQAEACGRRLAKVGGTVDAFHASPLGRTRQTAAILRKFGRYPETHWDARLQEVSLGSWDGLIDADIDAGWPGMLDGASPHDWFFRAPDGESYEATMDRVSAWLRGLNGTVVAVSHGLVGRLIRGAYMGLARDAALRLPVPQDVIWHMAEGRITPLG
jgi:probable phosphoglycerate mutase